MFMYVCVWYVYKLTLKLSMLKLKLKTRPYFRRLNASKGLRPFSAYVKKDLSNKIGPRSLASLILKLRHTKNGFSPKINF